MTLYNEIPTISNVTEKNKFLNVIQVSDKFTNKKAQHTTYMFHPETTN